MNAVWRFVTDNQQVLTWLGGGVAVLAGGCWTVAKFFLKHDDPRSVSATGGVAVGGRVGRSTITVHNAAPPESRPE